MTKKQLENQIKKLEGQIEHLGNILARDTGLVQTQDGEIGRLTSLNDRMFRVIDKLITKEDTV